MPGPPGRAPERAPAGYGLAVTGMDLASARLVPAAADGGSLRASPRGRRLRARRRRGGQRDGLGLPGLRRGYGAARWCGPRLADPRAAPWPPFVLVAARGTELVVVVHGPVEVTVEREDGQERFYGGDEVGSWLNKVLQQVQGLSAGGGAHTDGLVDLREGVVRAGGFLLVPGHHQVRPQPSVPRPDAVTEDHDHGVPSRPAPGTGAGARADLGSLTSYNAPG